MRTEGTIYANHKLIINEVGTPVGVLINGEIAFNLYDSVEVTDDGHGYICPGIKHAGIGRIVEIRRDNTDHFYGVRMANGEFGFMKHERMKRSKTSISNLSKVSFAEGKV